MNKSELKQARRELVYYMRELRKIQKKRKNNTFEETYNSKIDDLIEKIQSDYYFNIYEACQIPEEPLDRIIEEMKQKKKKKTK